MTYMYPMLRTHHAFLRLRLVHCRDAPRTRGPHHEHGREAFQAHARRCARSLKKKIFQKDERQSFGLQSKGHASALSAV